MSIRSRFRFSHPQCAQADRVNGQIQPFEVSTSPHTGTLKIGALLLVLASTSFYFLTLHLADPWIYSNDSNGPMNAIFAKNYLRYGYQETRLGQLMLPKIWGEDLGSPGLLRFYVDHPPLVPLLVSLSFAIFGMTEASARYVPLLFSVLSIWLVFLIARQLYGSPLRALLAVSFYAFTPMFLFFGQMPNHEPVVNGLVLTAVYFYLLWLDTNRPVLFVLLVLTMIVGALAGWPAYYLGLLIPMHYRIFVRNTKFRLTLLLTATCVAMFGLFLIHVYSLEGYPGIMSLASKFFIRAGGGFSIGEFLRTELRYFNYGFTPALILMAALYFCVRAIAFKNLSPRAVQSEAALMLLFSVAIIHVFLFKQGALAHPYWIYYFAAPLAIAASGLIQLPPVWHHKLTLTRTVNAGVLLCCLLLFFVTSVPRVRMFYSKNRVEAYKIGLLINKLTVPGDVVFTSLNYMGTQLPYYADRNIHYGVRDVSHFKQFMALVREGCNVYLSQPNAIVDGGLAQALKGADEPIFAEGYVFIKMPGCENSRRS